MDAAVGVQECVRCEVELLDHDIEADFLEFNAGMTATISLADSYGKLVN
jgi:hypothetical protein